MALPSNEPGRKTPEEILESIEREARGKLTIYLGSSAGVGKTYSMLEAARERKNNAVDVVIGWVETHGRRETEKLIEGLERIPAKTLEYRDKAFQEMDLDAILKRKPTLALVDELAHTNIPGSRHARRFQDVDELLGAGINVYTTLNIQHVESLNDLVAQITGIVVRETIPDRLVEEADFIRLIDISTDELISRFKEGKVYIPMQAEQALTKFFRPGNLNALRELAMRYAAKRVDRDISDYMRSHHIEGPWPIAGNVMVCVGASPFAAQLIRAAHQLAAGLRSDWFAVHIETRRRPFLMGEREVAQLEKNMRLAEELGARTFSAVGKDLVGEILELARVHNVNAIVVGKPRHNKLWDLIYGSVVDSLSRRSVGINIYVIHTETPEEKPLPVRTEPPAPPSHPEHYAGGLFMMALVTVVGWIFRDDLNLINIAFLYQLPVVLSASWWGRWPSYVTAICSMIAFNFFFIPPIFTFMVHDVRYVGSFVVFLIVAFIIGGKTEQLRLEAISARMREKSTRTLYDFSKEIAGSVDLARIVQKLCKQVAETLEREVVVFIPRKHNELEAVSYYSPMDKKDWTDESGSTSRSKPPLGSSDIAVATWVYTHAQSAGAFTETLSQSPFLFIPLSAKGKVEGVMGVRIIKRNLFPEERRLLETWVWLAAIAIERVKLEEAANEAAILAESERLHTALFNSLSHELRTPLSSIIGASSTLIESKDVYSDEQKYRLLEEIRGGARRLERVVANLLDTARLESGMLELKRDSCDIEDIVGAALRQMKDLLKETKIETGIPPGISFIPGDCVLLELTIVNLLDNAIKFSPPGSTVRINAVELDEFVRMSVIDEGPGIEPGELTRIFDKFYRVPSTDKTVYGSGLGLSICKAIIEAHGGVISAENRPGGGVVISFTVPKEINIAGGKEKEVPESG